jgi:hypothetical protein
LTWAAALFLVAAFLVLARWFRVPARVRAVLGDGRRAFHDLRDPSLGERDKERAVQSHAGRLLLGFVGITLASAVAVALPFGVVALLDAAGVVELDAVLARTVSPAFLLVVTPLAVVAAVILRGHRP